MGGATISDPPNDGQGFSSLKDGDLAILSFAGDPIPVSATMQLISRHGEVDHALYDLLVGELDNHSMVALSDERLSELSVSPDLGEQQPLHKFISQTSASAKAVAECAPRNSEIGVLDRDKCRQLGRQVVEAHFEQLQKAGVIKRVTAIDDSAMSGFKYDFRVEECGGNDVLIGVKALAGTFGAPLSISTQELIPMRDAPHRYDLFCVYELADDGGKFRISANRRGLPAFKARLNFSPTKRKTTR